jgi:hypothetical protein
MKFQKRLQSEAPSLLISEDYRIALIKYKVLKKHIGAMCSTNVHDRSQWPQAECDCCICLEQFHSSSSMISTRCGHSFHAYCLIKSLSSGTCNCCPLCRHPAAGLLPTGNDGDCFRFLAMVHVNANAVQRCHQGTLRLIESELQHYQQRAAKLQMWPIRERLALEAEVLKSLEQLDATMQYGALNYEGFRKILKKFDKRTGCAVSSSVLADIQRHGFFLDNSALGNGRCAVLRIALSSLLRDLHIRQLISCLPSNMPLETSAAAAAAAGAAGGGAARGA